MKGWKGALIAAVVAAVLVLTAGLVVVLSPTPTEREEASTGTSCLVPGQLGGGGGTVATLNAEQTANARAIIGAGLAAGVPTQGLVVAIATAMQESTLRNVNYGDRAGPDSRGLFQQRNPWGTLAERMDPATAATLFFKGGRSPGTTGLLGIAGWESLPVTVAAQRVQRSAFPGAYAKHTALAVQTVSAILASEGTTLPVTTPGCRDVEQLAGACAPSGLAIEAQITPDARNVVRCVVAMMPTQYGIGGYAKRNVSGTSKVSDHASGRAVDVMTNPGGRRAQGAEITYGDQVAAYFAAHADEFGVTYIIWKGQIRSAGGEWRPYKHPGGVSNPTLDHYDHVHVSVRGSAGTLLSTPTSGLVLAA